ncbi:hypothetical protein JCM19046_4036 [Bacillus sp. JCM 19046]|uniref:Lipoprotein n=1 Tax=Shouchella xiaoxiensis TaxID=766895 RepID=A0ABS2SWK5_9BACI|nr:hypothetical protein [Shouchella xiaoxiensis]MBM7838617.1 hypothetical protein [Shouchella xiaoxiensis]GAF13329.1 hypothetical protein JCM19045_2569 [Bacillus sp. JCM 19045]GAF19390.1 hypothetical protein JCM19046_4036 [Bacillus sp. JCM 19046]
MDMKKTATAVVVAGAVGAITVCLTDETRREQVKAQSRNVLNKLTGKTKEEKIKTFQLGNPQPSTEDSKMVDEGSLYSIQRYNEKYQ